MDSPYDVLSIDPDADRAEIVRAYRRRVKEAHPDHGGSVEEFRRVTAAYEQLVSGGRQSGSIRETDSSRQSDATVTFLNYEVLDDHGWSLEDDDLFEKASDANLDPEDYGRILVEPDELLLEAAENRGFSWPFACRGGACANCAVAVTEGELSTPVNHILPQEMLDRGIRLSCVGSPITEDLNVVYNVKHLPDLDELRLPPRPFEGSASTD